MGTFKISKGLLLAPLTFFLGCCCNSTPSKNTKKITINIESNYTSLDPRKTRVLTDYNIIRTFNEGLFRHEENGITKAIAKSFEVSKDQKTYKIHLKDTYWSNGDPLVAQDFIYAWRSLLHKNFPSPNAYFLYYIKNAQKIKMGLLDERTLGAYALDRHTLLIELEKPTPFLFELLSLPIYFPIHRHIDRKSPNWTHGVSSYVCNGPFKPTLIKENDTIIAVKNPTYWDNQNVFLETIEMVMLDEYTAYNLYMNKGLHFIGSPFSNIPTESLSKHLKDNTAIVHPFLGTYWIRVNTDSPALKNKDLRKALALSIDRKNISDHMFGGTLETATSIVPYSMGLHEERFFQDGNTALANKHLQKVLNFTKEIPTLTLSYINTQVNSSIALVIQDTWKKTLNINILLEPLEYKVFFDRIQNKDFDLAYSGKMADFSDPIDFLQIFTTKDTGTNNTGWEDERFYNLIKKSYQIIDPEKRREIYASAEKIIMEDMPIIPMHHLKMIYLCDEKLKDIVITKTGIIDFKKAYLSK